MAFTPVKGLFKKIKNTDDAVLLSVKGQVLMITMKLKCKVTERQN